MQNSLFVLAAYSTGEVTTRCLNMAGGHALLQAQDSSE